MLRWEADARRCHINWIILDSDWEADFKARVESEFDKMIDSVVMETA